VVLQTERFDAEGNRVFVTSWWSPEHPGEYMVELSRDISRRGNGVVFEVEADDLEHALRKGCGRLSRPEIKNGEPFVDMSDTRYRARVLTSDIRTTLILTSTDKYNREQDEVVLYLDKAQAKSLGRLLLGED